jgi:hypothetical protein
MINSKKLLNTESNRSPLLASTLLICTISSFTTFAFDSHSIISQLFVLLHLISGVFFSLIIINYIFIHTLRTSGFRRPATMLSGISSGIFALILISSGIHIIIAGHTEVNQWTYSAHIYSSYLFLSIIFLHILIHIKTLANKRKNDISSILPSIPKHTSRYIFKSIILISIIFITLSSAYYLYSPIYSDLPAIDNYEYSYGPHPFRPSQTETIDGNFIDEKEISNSHRCFSCHEDISKQWVSSSHKQAASDPAYVKNISLLVESKGISAARYCEGCHSPVALLTGQLTPGGKHGGDSQSPAHHEGLSCISCHGIDSLPHRKGLASYTFSPPKDYLFAQSDNTVLINIHNLLVNVSPRQHKSDFSKPILKKPELCLACHKQYMEEDFNNWGWVKLQDDYSAWVDSPFSNKNKHDFSNAEVKICQDCHMPLVQTNDPSADINRNSKSHRFAAANTFLPSINGDKEQLEHVVAFLQSNKMKVTIDIPKRDNSLRTLHSIDESIRDSLDNPHYYYLGETADINIIISNIGVGHNFPAGTTDINQAWIEIMAQDADGNLIFQNGNIDELGFVDKNSYFYKSIPVDKKGQHVWKHDLFNMTGKSFNRVVKSGESDIANYKFEIPAWANSPLSITATLKYRKFNKRYSNWVLGKEHIEIPAVNMAWDSINTPIKLRLEVE